MNPPLVKLTHNPVSLDTSLLKEPEGWFQRTLTSENDYSFLVSLYGNRITENPK